MVHGLFLDGAIVDIMKYVRLAGLVSPLLHVENYETMKDSYWDKPNRGTMAFGATIV